MTWTRTRPCELPDGFKLAAVYENGDGIWFTVVALPFSKQDVIDDYVDNHGVIEPPELNHSCFLVWDNVLDRAETAEMGTDGEIVWRPTP